MESAELISELQARVERLEVLARVSVSLHSTLEAREGLRLLLGEAIRLLGAQSGTVCLINPTTGFVEIEAARGLSGHAPELRLRIGEGITGWVARTGRAVRVGDVTKDRGAGANTSARA